MIFNTIEFGLFLPIVFAVYWLIGSTNRKEQNIFLTAASYFFYGFWDYRFLFLIIFSSLLDYLVAIELSKASEKRKRNFFLGVSLVCNLGLLLFFKYYNFFVESFIDSFQFFGVAFEINTLKIVLPVGISFYTFQTLSYTIDVYKRKLTPTTELSTFLAYVSFFPQLVAGPIERATNLIPQFSSERSFSYEKSIDGVKQILWGMFKKVVIADQFGIIADAVFNDYASYGGPVLVLGAVAFAFQIYGDFSGYSDMALGLSKLFGFELMDNFRYPYFSRNIGEFWRRWHISLSTWFRDYLYIPLGGSKGNKFTTIKNIFVIFVVSGFWHGANWTFIFWGFFHALLFIPLFMVGRNRSYFNVVAADKPFPSLMELWAMLRTFSLVTISWVFFRSESIEEAFSYLKNLLFRIHKFSIPEFISLGYKLNEFIYLLLFLTIMLMFEWINREHPYGMKRLPFSQPVRYMVYYALVVLVLLHLNTDRSFIYFQF